MYVRIRGKSRQKDRKERKKNEIERKKGGTEAGSW
jgi:hypothetical protein